VQLAGAGSCSPSVAGRTIETKLVRLPAVDVRMLLAVAAVWIFWGSTFAAMRYAVATIPPFPMAAFRFVIAGAILYAISVLRGKARPARHEVIGAAVTGATLLLVGNGTTAWTVQYLPTGVNSLLLSLSPVWMALIAFAWGGERPTRLAVLGMVLAFVGLALLVQPKATSGLPFWPAAVALLSCISWAFGSIYQRRSPRSTSLVRSTALQMLFGGAFLALEAAVFGQWRTFDVHAVTASSLGGMLWLIVFGSLVAYSSYLYTMRADSTALASTYAYVNPIVAVIIGIVLFHERFTPLEALAGAIILGGVALMMIPRRGAHGVSPLAPRA